MTEHDAAGGRDCLVVGAGAIGMGIAWELARTGAEVTLVERSDRCGEGTSSAAAGMLAAGVEASSPGAFLDLCRRSAQMWADWSSALMEETGVDCEYERCGLLRVTATSEGSEALLDRRRWQLTEGIEVSELLSREEILEEVAGLGPEVVAGLCYPGEGQVHTHRLVEALEAACRRVGVRILTSTEVADFDLDSTRPAAISAGGGRLEAERIVITTGPWSGRLLEKIGLAVAIEPVRGQIAAVTKPAGSLRRILFGDHGYIVQKRSGLTLVGATEEALGFSSWVSLGGLAELAGVAQQLLPDLAAAPLAGSWAGLRPFSRRGLLLGAVGGNKAVLLATGHFRNGILLAPVTASLLTRAILEGEEPAALGPFSPGRVD